MINRIVGPETFTPARVDLKQPKTALLSNDVEVFLFNAGEQEVCKIELIFPGGKYVEPKAATSFFTLKMLLEGSQNYSSSEISDFFDYHGAFLDFSSTLDDNQVTLYCRTEHISELLPIFKEVVFNPNFKSEKLTKLKERQLQQLKINLQKTSYWATKLLRNNLFGPNHPYGRLMEVEDIKQIEIADLVDYHKRFIAGVKFDVFVSGKFNTNGTIDLIEQNLGRQIANIAATGIIAQDSGKSQLIVKALKESNQASVKMGYKSLGRSAENYPLLALSNKILGGYFGSRLMKVIREEKGLTYGIYSMLGHFSHDSFLQIAADVKKDSWELVIDLVKTEINKLRDQGVSDNELSLVKNFMMGEFQNEVNTTFDLSTKFKMLRYNRLDADYYNNFHDTIQSASNQQVQDIVDRYIDPDQLVVVAVQ